MSEPQFTDRRGPVRCAPKATAAPSCVGARSILLCNDGGAVFALENLCRARGNGARWRAGSSLVSCLPVPRLALRSRDRRPLNPPASEAVATFPVRIEDGTIAVAV